MLTAHHFEFCSLFVCQSGTPIMAKMCKSSFHALSDYAKFSLVFGMFVGGWGSCLVTKCWLNCDFLPPPPKNLTVVHAVELLGATVTWHMGFVEACIIRSSKGLFVIIKFGVLPDSQSAEWRYDIRRRYVIYHRLTTGGSPQDGLILRTNRRAGSCQWTWRRLLPRFVKVYRCCICRYEAMKR